MRFDYALDHEIEEVSTMSKTVMINDGKIEIGFDFDLTILDVVRKLPDREWDKPSHPRLWIMPNTPFHCAIAIEHLEPMGFWIAPDVRTKANGKASKPTKLSLPDGLYTYQKQGVEFIYGTYGRAIVADDMGLGKTIEALTFVDQFARKTLVIAPANVLFKWALKEVPMWAKGKTVQVILTGKQEIEDRDITILSYGIMVSKFEELNVIPFDAMVFDEAHYLKNYKAQRTKVAKRLVKGVPHLLFLSGTPFMNKRMELFPLLNMLDPKSFSNAIQFGVRYAGGVFQHGHWVVPPVGRTNTEELKERLSRIMVRRTKREVASQLPALTRVSIPVEIENRKEYEREIRETRKRIREHKGKMTSAVLLSLMSKLRQIIGHGKVKAAVELAEDILESGNQVVLFAHHIAVVEELKEALHEHGVGVISGDVPAKDRQRLIDMFLQSKDLRVMVITVAGAEGIDLYSASNIVFVEREWTPAKEEQAESRSHRNGQVNPVSAYYMVAKGTLDEHFDEIVRRKRVEFTELIESDIIQEVRMSLYEGV